MGKSVVTGIDIGYHSIKVVVLKPYKGTFALVGYQELAIESDIFSDNHVLNYQKIVKKLKELRKSLPRFSRKVALALPDNAVISKLLQIDSGVKEQEREYALLEAFSAQSPFPLEELSLDFVETGADSHSQTRQFQVFATKKELVENRIQVLLGAGFDPFMFDLQAHCLVQIWQLTVSRYRKSDWLLVNIGSQTTTVCIDFSHQAPYCKDIAIGISQHEHPADELEELIVRLQRTIQLVNSMHDCEVEGLWLCGEAALITSLLEPISYGLGLECQLLNPFELLKNRVDKKTSSELTGCSFVCATGTALRGLNWLERQGAA